MRHCHAPTRSAAASGYAERADPPCPATPGGPSFRRLASDPTGVATIRATHRRGASPSAPPTRPRTSSPDRPGACGADFANHLSSIFSDRCHFAEQLLLQICHAALERATGAASLGPENGRPRNIKPIFFNLLMFTPDGAAIFGTSFARQCRIPLDIASRIDITSVTQRAARAAGTPPQPSRGTAYVVIGPAPCRRRSPCRRAALRSRDDVRRRRPTRSSPRIRSLNAATAEEQKTSSQGNRQIEPQTYSKGSKK